MYLLWRRDGGRVAQPRAVGEGGDGTTGAKAQPVVQG